MLNKNNQNTQKQQSTISPTNNNKSHKSKIKRLLTDQNGLLPISLLPSCKNYSGWKDRRLKKIQFQQVINTSNDPIFGIALNCGIKNGINQVIHQYTHPQNFDTKREIINNTVNSFQRILSSQNKTRVGKDRRNLTFVNFKTKRNTADKLMSSVEMRSQKHSSQSKQRAKTQQSKFKRTVMINKQKFRKTGMPTQLLQLKQQIQALPSVKNTYRKQSNTMPTFTSAYPQQFNQSFMKSIRFNQSMMESMMQTQINDDDQTYERRLVRQCKSQTVNEYIQQLNEVITFADEVMDEQIKAECQQYEASQHEQAKQSFIDKKKLAIYRKYWPEYKRCSLNSRRNPEQQQVSKFFNSFSYSECELGEQMQGLVTLIKNDLYRQQKIMNRQIVEQQKNAVDQRYKYKLNFERQSYKRNVKSYIKCKKQYRIQKRRQQVRANGIIRVKKANNIQKIFKNKDIIDNQ